MNEIKNDEACVKEEFKLDFSFLYGEPRANATFKQLCEDFIVTENLGFELTGEGEHVCLWIEKIGENTQYLARQLAKFAEIPAKNVSYAGLKDRQAVTYQWFSLHIPGKLTPDFSKFTSPGVTILEQKRHNKKIRTGALDGNYFSIILKDIDDKEMISNALNRVEKGVPNYFGAQRFGHNGHNVGAALTMFKGRKIKDRFKRGIYLSAARSYLFNHMVSQRIDDHFYEKPMLGDCVQFVGNRSFFPLTDLKENTLDRLNNREICLTAPMWGAGELTSTLCAKEYELENFSKFKELKEGLAKHDLKQERRPLMLIPTKFSQTWLDDKTVKVEFYLTSGSYATTVLREVFK